MRTDPKPLELYRHFKGNIYQIRCLARHTETGEMMVVYQAMYDAFEIYVRPLAMFMEEVDHAQYPDAKQRYRFELLQDMERAEDSRQSNRVVAAVEEPEHDRSEVFCEKKIGYDEPENSCEKESQTLRAEENEVQLDPLVADFLDADTYEKRLDILVALHDRITNDMINTLAVAVDLEIKEGNVESRYEELKNCLLTFEKYECNRLR